MMPTIVAVIIALIGNPLTVAPNFVIKALIHRWYCDKPET